ncbi:MAG: ThuA domain-containing protein [Lachnospiraceae bacterium]|nr:ThuA domain-containing protein [Lachnospiraceae bacterium]
MLHVTVFNEFVHEKRHEKVHAVYPEGIHSVLKERLEDEEISVRTVTLDDPECGLTEEVLKETDVLIWWGHMRHELVPDEVAVRVQHAVISGMGAIFLHSAHHSKPFKLLMGTPCNLGWRENGDREYVWVVDPSHPIVQGIGRYFKLEHEETYSEPFSIPEPDKLLLIGNYSGGEVFRSGCLYRRGNGKVFYFQPGHETYPIFYDDNVIRIIKNAIRFLASDYRQEIDCPHITKIED